MPTMRYNLGADAFVYVAAGGGGGSNLSSMTGSVQRMINRNIREAEEYAQARAELERVIRKRKHRDSIGSQTYIPFPDLKENL